MVWTYRQNLDWMKRCYRDWRGRGDRESNRNEFRPSGSDVVIAEIDANAGASIAEEVHSTGGRSLFIRTDVTKADQISELIKTTQREFGHIDILVNNVGSVAPMTPVVNINEKTWDLLVRVNLTSVFLCSKAVSRVMIAQNKGNIVRDHLNNKGIERA